MWETGKTYVGRLQARGSSCDALALRVRLGSALAAADLHPPALPASAVLCVRELRDPLPGSLGTLRTGAAPPAPWLNAVHGRLDRLARQAARPALGPVPAGAEAVLFLDWAELLACLAVDWLEGDAARRWWWRSLLGTGEIRAALAAAWGGAPEYVSAALHDLACRGQAAPFVNEVSTAVVISWLQAVAQRFALPDLGPVVELLRADFAPSSSAGHERTPPVGGPTAEAPVPTSAAGERVEPTLRRNLSGPPRRQDHAASSAATGTDAPAGRDASDQAAGGAAPWQPWAPEAEACRPSLERQCLLGIALTLHRVPAVVRSSAFGPAVLDWCREERLRPQSAPERVASATSRPAPPTGRVPQDRAGLPAHSSPSDPTGPPERVEPVPVALSSNPWAGSTAEAAGPPPEPVHAAPPASARPSSSRPLMLVPLANAVATNPLVPTGTATVRAPSAADAPGELSERGACVETDFGGLFYLINLGLFLNLYGDFTTPARPGIPLSVWDYVALLGRELLGPALDADPVWSLLARLAGRGEQEAPGQDYQPPGEWVMPVEWLTAFPEAGRWLWAAEAGRLRLWHPCSFCVLDVPRTADDPGQQIAQVTRAYRIDAVCESEAQPLPGATDEVSPLERWLGWLMPYVRARLVRALGLESPAELGQVLCARPARVIVTAARLDVYLGLAELPITVRLAGLDRDPGWVPAAGRFLAFHYD
jgi:hypothetical protein